MTLEDFWYEDEEIFHCYVKAYYQKLHKQGWVNGLYIKRAMETSLSDVMPMAIQLGLGFDKSRKISNLFEKLMYFEASLPDIVEKEQVRRNNKNRIANAMKNEDERMKRDRLAIQTFL